MKKWLQKVREAWNAQGKSGQPGDYIDVRPEKIDEAAAGVSDQAQPGLLGRLHHTSKRDQQIAALQAGYTELLDLIRAIREHLDNQAQAQTQIVQSVDRFNQTLALMDETSKRSAQTMVQLAERARDSEELLRTTLERSERRMLVAIGLLVAVIAIVLGAGLYIIKTYAPAQTVVAQEVAPVEESVYDSGEAIMSAEMEDQISDTMNSDTAPLEGDEVDDSSWEDIELEELDVDKPKGRRKFFLFGPRS